MSGAQAARRARARRAMIQQLKKAGALSDANARELEIDSSLERRVLARMIKSEVIRPGSKGGYWLDQERYAEWRRQQLLIAFGISLVLGGVVACLMIYEPSHARHQPAAADTVAADSVRPSR